MVCACVGCQMFPSAAAACAAPGGQHGPTARKSDRYVCHSADCLQKAIRHRLLERALETKLGDEVAQALQDALAALPPRA